MEISSEIRHANRWLFVGLVAFAIVFAVAVFWWMRVNTQRKGGKVYPAPSVMAEPNARPLSFAAANFSISSSASSQAL